MPITFHAHGNPPVAPAPVVAPKPADEKADPVVEKKEAAKRGKKSAKK